jgi:hypothetical protein
MKLAKPVILASAALLLVTAPMMAQASGADAGATGGVSGTGGPGTYFNSADGGNDAASGNSASPSYYNSSSTSDSGSSIEPVGLGAGSDTTMGLNTNIGPYNTNLGLDASGAASEGLAATSRNAGLIKPVDPYAPNAIPPASATIYGAGGMTEIHAASH